MLLPKELEIGRVAPPESWSVKTSAQRVLTATNAWLHAETRGRQHYNYDRDKGYVCTLSAMVAAAAHIFHVEEVCNHSSLI